MPLQQSTPIGRATQGIYAAPPLGVRSEIGGTTILLDVSALNQELILLNQGNSTSGITVEQASGLNPVFNVVDLRVSDSDGFIVSTESAGEAQLHLLEASLTQRGIVSVNLLGQVLGKGPKTVAGTLWVDQTLIGNPVSILRLVASGVVSGAAYPSLEGFSSNGVSALTGVCGYGQWSFHSIAGKSAFDLLDGLVSYAPIVYAINGTRGVTGTGNTVTATGGIVTAISTAPSGTGGGSGTLPTRLLGTVAATGSDQAGAAAIAFDNGTITGADGTKGVRLPDVASDGTVIALFNTDPAFAAKVYPPSGQKIDAIATNGADLIGGGASKIYWRVSTTQWTAR